MMPVLAILRQQSMIMRAIHLLSPVVRIKWLIPLFLMT